MEMTVFKEFRKRNHLLQKDVADYIGVSREYISMVESGKATLPLGQLRKLLNNTLGWDASMLDENQEMRVTKPAPPTEADALRKEVEMLRQQVAFLKEQNEKYWEMITRLTAR